MTFNPNLKINETISNKELSSIFQCGNMGGMRRSKRTGTLVLISDHTKGLYQDVWKNGVMHYTGMGKIGDQVLKGNQNITLYNSDTNGVEVHLFEVFKKAVYTYKGVVKLADKPYQSEQLDDNKELRRVWMFPLKPVDEEVVAPEAEVSEHVLRVLTDEELARRASIKNVGKKSRTVDQTVYYRDPYLKETVKRIAKGKCQLCQNYAPFVDKNNEPYLEAHHVERLADGGSDTIENIVAICPNCHRKMHILSEAKDKEALLEVAKKNKAVFMRLLHYAEGSLKEEK